MLKHQTAAKKILLIFVFNSFYLNNLNGLIENNSKFISIIYSESDQIYAEVMELLEIVNSKNNDYRNQFLNSAINELTEVCKGGENKFPSLTTIVQELELISLALKRYDVFIKNNENVCIKSCESKDQDSLVLLDVISFYAMFRLCPQKKYHCAKALLCRPQLLKIYSSAKAKINYFANIDFNSIKGLLIVSAVSVVSFKIGWQMRKWKDVASMACKNSLLL